MKKNKLLFILISLFVAGCEKVEQPSLINHIVPGDFIEDEFVFPMNTITQLRMYYQSQYDEVYSSFDNIVISLSKEVDRYHDYEGINNLKTINDSCGSDEYIKVSKELFDLIELSIDITKLSEGKFNLAMGNIIDLYSSKISDEYVGREDTLFDDEIINEYLANIPSYEEIDEVIKLNKEDNSIKLNKYNDNDVVISLGAIAKGFVMQKAYEFLKVYDYPALFDAGSSTMATINNKSEDGWNIGFGSANLEMDGGTLTTVNVKGDHFISTSGDYQQYFKYKDENGNYRLMHHIIDPNTGISNSYLRAVTLLSNNASLAVLDALSTVLFNCYDDEEALSMISLFEQSFNCDISFLISKPVIDENEKYNYELFNVLVSSSFDLLTVSEYNSYVVNKTIIDNY